MIELKRLYTDVLLNGEQRETRTGNVRSVWDRKVKFDLREGFPATTSKKLGWQSVVGELLWFLSGSTSLRDLKKYTFNDPDSEKWTIWTDDAKRWANTAYAPGSRESIIEEGYVGNLYPHQWRNYGYEQKLGEHEFHTHEGVDQIQNLITRLQNEPQRRDHIVTAWNPYDIQKNLMALKSCHVMFQCYVDRNNNLHLKWTQRSCDLFLGLSFNIASYALLTHLIADWCGLGVGTLTGDLGDVHIYENHIDAVNEYIENPRHILPQLVLPEQCKQGLEETLEMTALDFKDALVGYKHEGIIKAPLSVGV